MNVKRILVRIRHFWLFEIILGMSKRLVIPGFKGMSVYEVSTFFIRGIWKGSITTRAAALSFTFFLALFPAIIFFFTLIPYIPIHGFQNTLLTMLQNILPKDAYHSALNTLDDIIRRQHGRLLSFGFIVAVYVSTNGVSGIMTAFNNSIHIEETRSYFKQKLVAVQLVLIISTLAIIAISLLTAGNALLRYLLSEGFIQSSFTFHALIFVKWIIIIALFFFVISFLYYLAPAKHGRFHFISPGSTLATILFILSSSGFNYYLSHFSQYNKLYGSIGALIIILMWIYINAIVLLIGFELNASIKNAIHKSQKKK